MPRRKQLYEFNDRAMSVSEIAAEMGVAYETMRRRITRVGLKRALAMGRSLTTKQVARQFNGTREREWAGTPLPELDTDKLADIEHLDGVHLP